MPLEPVEGVAFHGHEKPKPPEGLSRSEWIRQLHYAGHDWSSIRLQTHCTRQHFNSALAHRGPWGGGRAPRCQTCGAEVKRYKRGVYFHIDDPEVLAGKCGRPQLGYLDMRFGTVPVVPPPSPGP